VLSEDSDTLKETLAELRIKLKPSVYKMDVRPLLKVVLEAFFGPSVGLVDMITEFLPSPAKNAEDKVSSNFPRFVRDLAEGYSGSTELYRTFIV
jgi:U5 small nuclear ribonucleoprotein component